MAVDKRITRITTEPSSVAVNHTIIRARWVVDANGDSGETVVDLENDAITNADAVETALHIADDELDFTI